MRYVGGASRNTPLDTHNKLLIQSSGESVETGILTVHRVTSIRFSGYDTMKYVSFTILSVCALGNQVDRGLKWLTSRRTYRATKLPGMSQCCMWNPPSLSLPIFTSWLCEKCTASWSIRLLYIFHICFLDCWSVSFPLITCTRITSCTLLPCELTWVDFGSCLV